MTREELIKIIYDCADISTCPVYNCHEFTGTDGCLKCAEKQLAEYEKQIRAKAFDDGIAKIEEMLSRVFNDEDDYYLGIENGYQDCIRELEQLRGE